MSAVAADRGRRRSSVGESLPGLVEGAGQRDPTQWCLPVAVKAASWIWVVMVCVVVRVVPVVFGTAGRLLRWSPMKNQSSLMFFSPNGLDTEGIAGAEERSRLVRPVSGRGPLSGGMARTDGARERWRFGDPGSGKAGPEDAPTWRWLTGSQRALPGLFNGYADEAPPGGEPCAAFGSGGDRSAQGIARSD